MMLYAVLGLICFVLSKHLASPVPLADDVFADFLQNAPNRKGVVVNRRMIEDNANRPLKQISLSSLIGELENNIFASATNFDKVLTSGGDGIQEIKVNNDTEHDDANKVKSFAREERLTTTPTESGANLAVTDKMIFQTEEKVSQTNGVSTHIVIDRIAIQPHTGGLVWPPIFEFKQNRKGKDESFSTNNSSTSESTYAEHTTTTTEAAMKTLTTHKNIRQLKEAEEELKEKFAEIEAEPIILSARV